MKISLHWLSDFVDIKERNPQAIADTMTVGMGEVDDTEVMGALLAHCVVGKVRKKEKHPNADKLSVCEVETDQGVKIVVCGGTNVREGMLVAFAHTGATVKWHGGDTMTLSKVTIRGVESEGMICAQEELGLTSFPPSKEDGERPIVDLSSLPANRYSLAVGTPLKEALQQNDVIFHIDNHAITNRPDLFSHIGVARELVAMGLAKWKKQPSVRTQKFPTKKLPFKTKNAVPSLVPRYFGCVLSIDSLGVTPDWMKARLEAIGVRSISLPVDITNYVSAEIGMPLHSFDVGDISGNIEIRTSKKGEKIVTLDEVERPLPDGAIVLSDDEGIFDLLGIMGGKRSSTKDTTRMIYLHAAIVDPVSIRRAIIATSHRTDASTVYEKGIPFSAAEAGFYRALELMLAHVPGAKIESELEEWGKDEKRAPITLKDGAASRVIGSPITGAEAKKILTNLGYEVVSKGKDLSVTPPLWRKDVSGAHDVVEDIARIVGYNRIKSVVPVAPIAPPARDTRLHRMRDSLKECGFSENVHLAFVSPSLLSACGIDPETTRKIENPLGEELSLLRTHLFPRLLETAAREERARPKASQCLFEVGKIFEKKAGESLRLTLLLSSPDAGIAAHPLLHVKQALFHALSAAGYAAPSIGEAAAPTYAHPGQCSVLKYGNQSIGFLWTLHPSIRDAMGMKNHIALASIDLDILFALPAAVKIVTPLPVFPAITFDETLPITAGSLFMRMKAKSASALLEMISVQGYYGARDTANVTLRFVYRSPEKTLTEDEAKKEHEKVLKILK
ncbi:MAG: phenylalanine--tRNA ligase subunit beta [Candidatus Peribacteraceae bacterium]